MMRSAAGVSSMVLQALNNRLLATVPAARQRLKHRVNPAIAASLFDDPLLEEAVKPSKSSSKRKGKCLERMFPCVSYCQACDTV